MISPLVSEMRNMLFDGAVVLVENALRKLHERQHALGDQLVVERVVDRVALAGGGDGAQGRIRGR